MGSAAGRNPDPIGTNNTARSAKKDAAIPQNHCHREEDIVRRSDLLMTTNNQKPQPHSSTPGDCFFALLIAMTQSLRMSSFLPLTHSPSHTSSLSPPNPFSQSSLPQPLINQKKGKKRYRQQYLRVNLYPNPLLWIPDSIGFLG